MSCVYKHTFPNGAIYIGRTDMEPEERWMGGWGYRQMPMIFNAIIKYGWDNVKHEILYDNLSHDEAVELEKKVIKEECTKVELTYNLYSIPAQEPAQSSAQKRPQHGPYKQHIIPIVEKPQWLRSCPIDVYTEDGEFITTYPNIKITAEELKINQGNIASCCKGVRGTGESVYTVNHYIFRYAPDKLKEMV